MQANGFQAGEGIRVEVWICLPGMNGTTRNISDNLLFTGSYGESSSRSFPKNNRKIGFRLENRHILGSFCYWIWILIMWWLCNKKDAETFKDFKCIYLALVISFHSLCRCCPSSPQSAMKTLESNPGWSCQKTLPLFAKEGNQRGRNQWRHKPRLPPGANGRKVTLKSPHSPAFFWGHDMRSQSRYSGY